MSTRYDVFISYKSEDLALAQTVHDCLKPTGLEIWFDRVRLEPGFNWHDEIEAGCENSRILLPVLTPRWQTSEWTKFETYGAEAVIPLHVEGEWEDVAPPPLRRYQASVIDLRHPGETDWGGLIAAVRDCLAQPPPDKEKRLAHVGYRANPAFVGREDDLIRINEALHREPGTALTRGSVHAISALGGIGKTTLARQYVEKFWRLYRQIFWVDARTDPAAGFAEIALSLFPDAVNREKEPLARRALEALSDRTERLLVLDDVQDEESIQGWIPKSGGCHTIITSRFAGWSAAVESIPIYLLDPVHSRELLRRRAGRRGTREEEEACDRLAEALDYLPLALEQAAAYIRLEGPGFGFDDYLRIYGESARSLLAKRALGSTQYPDSVVTTWSATLAKLSWTARAVLRLASFLSSSPIPKAMFVDAAETILDRAGSMATREGPASPGGVGPEDGSHAVREAIQELTRYSMVTSHGHEITLHALVQTVGRFQTPEAEYKGMVVDAVRVLRRARPPDVVDPERWHDWGTWLPHAEAAVAHAEKAGVRVGIGELIGWSGSWYEQTADYEKAENAFRKALRLDEVLHGDTTPIVAVRLNNLAGVIMARGRLSEAESLFCRALEIVGDRDRGFRCRLLNNLGLLCKATGRLRDAETKLLDALELAPSGDASADDIRATLLANLAGVHFMTNRFESAERHFAEALRIHRVLDGDHHPAVVTPMLSMAELYVATNRLEDAARLGRDALSICEGTYGRKHPETAVCYNELGRVYEEMGRHDEAELLYRQALEIDLAAYGQVHERVSIRLNNLAEVLRLTDRLDEAEEAMKQSLEIRERTLGGNHPLTIHMYGRLALVLLQEGALEEAEDLARRSVAGWLISETPRTYKSGRAHRVLALVLDRKGRKGEAQELMKEAVSIYEETLVPGDPRLESIRREAEGIGTQ